MSSNKRLKKMKQMLRFLPDSAYIHLYYFAKFRKLGNFRNPETFNEKLQWLKLNYYIPEHARLVDKHDVKPIIESAIGSQYVIPTLAIYESAEDIDFGALPDAFVLKCTHDSEGVAIVKNKHDVDLQVVRQRLKHALAQNFFYIGREPHYRNLQPRILAEPLLQDDKYDELLDFKFFCFDGEVKAMFIASDRASGHPKFDYFDENFVPIDLKQSYSNSTIRPEKPSRYEEMVKIARELSKGHPHVRVDLYEVNGQVYFGELTFYHFSGFSPFVPERWDRVWGEWLTLPQRARSK